MKTVPKISCCMMVKDEEKNITRCLESIKGHVDEIIVVDTGSTDRTVEIVSEYTDKIYHHPWENDFSKHRNQSISYASGDWILILDADEELVNGGDLRRFIVQGEMDAIGFTVYDFDSSGGLICASNSIRMFRNGKGIHYEGIVHNHLFGVEHVKITPLSINHYGYKQDPETDNKKFLRTSTLLKKQLDLGIDPDRDRAVTHLYLSASYAMVEKHDECLEEALTAIDIIEAQDIRLKEYIRAYMSAARVLIQNKNSLSEAETICRKAIDRFDEKIDSSAFLVLIYHRQKKWNQLIEAAECYLRELEAFDKNRLTIAMRHINTAGEKWKIVFCLGDAHLHKDNIRLALSLYEQAYQLSHNKTECAGKAGASLYGQRHYVEAKKFFNLAYQGQDQEKNFLVLEGLFKTSLNTGDEDLSKKIVTDVLGLPSNEKAFSFQKDLGAYSFERRNYTYALIFFDSCSRIDPDDLDARLFKAKILLMHYHFESLIAECDELLRIVNLPRNFTVNSLEDIKGIFDQIAERLIDTNNADAARKAEDLAKNIHTMLLKRDASRAVM